MPTLSAYFTNTSVADRGIPISEYTNYQYNTGGSVWYNRPGTSSPVVIDNIEKRSLTLKLRQITNTSLTGSEFSFNYVPPLDLYVVGLSNSDGQLGTGNNVGRTLLTYITGFYSKVMPSMGANFAIALSSNNNVLLGTGLNNAGYLGQGDTISRNTFTPLTGRFSDFNSRYYTVYALSADVVDRWLACGSNQGGQFGLGIPEGSFYSMIPLTGRWSRIEPCNLGTFALSSGTVDKWFFSGNANYGNAGFENLYNNVTLNLSSFTPLSGNFSNVVCGDLHTFALSSNTNIWFCAGKNTLGELGLGYNSSALTPGVSTFTPVLSGSWSKIVCGGSFTFAQSSNTFKWFSTGYNGFGQLGLGDTTSRNTFTPITGNWSNIVAGGNSVFALSANSNLWYACGRNNNTQLGLGDNTNRSLLTPLLSGLWTTIYSGTNFTMALNYYP